MEAHITGMHMRSNREPDGSTTRDCAGGYQRRRKHLVMKNTFVVPADHTCLLVMPVKATARR